MLLKIIKGWFFILDSNNCSEFVNNFMWGYKKDDNFGFYWLLKKTETNIIFQSSTISPCLCYYKDDNYWAISNSLFYLEKHLIKQNKKLTLNKTWSYWENKIEKPIIFGSYSNNVNNYNITKFNEINLFDLTEFPCIDILKRELVIKKKELSCFMLNLKDSFDLINSWLNDWRQWTRDNMPDFELSGGIDCTLLYLLFNNGLTKCNINIFENINNDYNQYIKYQHEYLFIQDIAKKLHLPYVVYNNITDHWINDEEPSEVYNEFFYGISITVRGLNRNLKKNVNVVSGSCAAVFKYPKYLSSIKYFIFIRRFIMTQFIAKYYLYNIKTMLPYLDNRLLKIHFDDTLLLHIILILKYNKDLLKFNFIKADEIYTVEEKYKNLIEKANKIIDENN